MPLLTLHEGGNEHKLRIISMAIFSWQHVQNETLRFFTGLCQVTLPDIVYSAVCPAALTHALKSVAKQFSSATLMTRSLCCQEAIALLPQLTTQLKLNVLL